MVYYSIFIISFQYSVKLASLK